MGVTALWRARDRHLRRVENATWGSSNCGSSMARPARHDLRANQRDGCSREQRGPRVVASMASRWRARYAVEPTTGRPRPCSRTPSESTAGAARRPWRGGLIPERVTQVINLASSASAARHAARATASNSTSWRGTTFADFWADRAYFYQTSRPPSTFPSMIASASL